MQKITYIISNIHKSLGFEWIALHLDKHKFKLDFILLNPGESELETFLRKHHIPVHRIPFKGKKDIPGAIMAVRKLLLRTKPAIIHTHLFEANIVGLTAGRMARIPKRIHTRHHSTYHHSFFPKAVRWDKYANRLSTHIVAISDTVTHTLTQKEEVSPEKITRIWHGFDLESFRSPKQEAVSALKKKYNPKQLKPVIGVISRLTEWKGVQYIIPAFQNLLKTYPDALLLLFNARGEYAGEIDRLLSGLPTDSYHKVEFENDIASLYHLFDVFVHVPYDNHSEAFGQTYIESMAAGIPLIATKSGIGNEILRNGENCVEVPYKDSHSIHAALIRVLENESLRKHLKEGAWASVAKHFTLNQMIVSLETLYLR